MKFKIIGLSSVILFSLMPAGCTVSQEELDQKAATQKAEADKLCGSIKESGSTCQQDGAGLSIFLPASLASTVTDRQLQELGDKFHNAAPSLLIWVKTPEGRTLMEADGYGVRIKR